MNLLKEKRRGKCVGGVETKISGLLINKKKGGEEELLAARVVWWCCALVGFRLIRH